MNWTNEAIKCLQRRVGQIETDAIEKQRREERAAIFLPHALVYAKCGHCGGSVCATVTKTGTMRESTVLACCRCGSIATLSVTMTERRSPSCPKVKP